MTTFSWMEDTQYLTEESVAQVHAAIDCAASYSAMCNPVGGALNDQYSKMLEAITVVRPDAATIIASVLYPCVSYGDLPIEQVRTRFGDEVATLISGVAKISAIGQFAQYQQDEGGQKTYEQLRKMLLAMVSDVRIIIVKIAEQISFFQQSKADNERCLQLAAETQAIYAPLANRLGISELKWQLEDFAFRYANPAEYKKIASGLAQKRRAREIYAAEFMVELRDALESCGVRAISIKSRVKHIYSIYMKMRRKNKDLSEIYDQIAVRVIVPDVAKCYSALSTIHAIYSPVPGEFDDYIASPKSNGYQSVHTAVVGPEARVIEIQVRTQAMHEAAEYGVAAHWVYKEGAQTQTAKARANWLANLLAWQHDVQADSGANQHFLFHDEVFAFTPQGAVKNLPKNATVLDFAYAIHTQVGHTCTGAKINGAIVPLHRALQNGDVVEILTQKHATPSRDWLDPKNKVLMTNRSRNKVAQWFRAHDFERHVHEGQHVVDKELKKEPGYKQIGLHKIVQQSPFNSTDHLFAAIARGEYTVQAMLRIIHAIQAEHTEATETASLPEDYERLIKASKMPAIDQQTLTRLALCCKPAPGDNIVGYVTLGRGITVHRKDCNNVRHLTDDERARLIDINWADHFGAHYPVDIVISADDSSYAVREVTQLLSIEK